MWPTIWVTHREQRGRFATDARRPLLKLLEGVRVLDFSRLYTLATCKLADMGADVIKIEEPPAGDYMRLIPPFVEPAGIGLHYLMLNRNKRSFGIRFTGSESQPILTDLIASADVVVESSLPGSMARFGLDYGSVAKIRPDIVYCSITGFGQDGPYAQLPSHGLNLDAAAGLVTLQRGQTGRPEIAFGLGIGVELGGLHAALAIVAALSP